MVPSPPFPAVLWVVTVSALMKNVFCKMKYLRKWQKYSPHPQKYNTLIDVGFINPQTPTQQSLLDSLAHPSQQIYLCKDNISWNSTTHKIGQYWEIQMADWGQEIQTEDRDQDIQIENQGEGWGWGLIMRAECPVLNALQISHF